MPFISMDPDHLTHSLPHWFTQRSEARLQFLYGDEHTPTLMEQLVQRILDFQARHGLLVQPAWSEQDVMLITYGDMVQQPGKRPLTTLYEFIDLHLKDAVNSVHILPYFPYSSDDGFAVIDYTTVNPQLGDWRDIERMGASLGLMTDLVINHVSRENLWFVDYLHDTRPGRDYFIELPADIDVSQVIRPRNLPLLTPMHTYRGIKHVWTTFSEDQVDLNFENPAVLFEMIDVLLLYLAKGSRYIRLDAVAFLWKRLGTRCINLRETHEVVKLFRDIMAVTVPGAVLITETNLPHGENISYFGSGDEAHMIYQFILPPLLLHALYHGNAAYLTRWAQDTPRSLPGCTFLNFLASHDGIGVRPVEGFLPPEDVLQLVDAMHEQGGYVSMKANGDGAETPYEINISLFDAFTSTCKGPDQWQVQRVLSAHTIMFALQGIPAVYLNSFVATPNDLRGVEQTGRTRSINRHKWQYEALMALLNNPDSVNATVFSQLKKLLSIRRRQPAFHPEASQKTLSLGAAVFAFWRISLDGEQHILVINNLTSYAQEISLPEHPYPEGSGIWRELIEQSAWVPDRRPNTVLAPYQSVWLEGLR